MSIPSSYCLPFSSNSSHVTPVFIPLRLRQVVGKHTVGGKLCRSCWLAGTFIRPGPWMVSHDPQWTGVWGLGDSVRSKQMCRHIEPVVGTKLCAGKTHVDIFRVCKCDLIVVPRVTGMRNNVSATSSSCLDRMSLQNPIANIDQVNRLLDDDVARQRKVPVPAAYSELVRGHVGHGRIIYTRRIVVS